MKIEDVQKLAQLSRIEIKKDEQKDLLKDMESILSYIDEIQEAVTNERKLEVGEHRNVMREDGGAHETEQYSKDLLGEAPEIKDGYIKVKQILG